MKKIIVCAIISSHFISMHAGQIPPYDRPPTYVVFPFVLDPADGPDQLLELPSFQPVDSSAITEFDAHSIQVDEVGQQQEGEGSSNFFEYE